MKIPQEFRLLVLGMEDYTMPTPFDERVWIANNIRLKDVRTCLAIGGFLRSVLGKNLSGPELREVWDACGPRFMFETDEQLRLFLGMMLDQLDEKVRRG